MNMEVCIDSVISAVEAELGGAARVELCSNLAEGGTTPSLGLFIKIKELVKIPVFVMIRPRGGDFLYSGLDFDVMKKEITIFKSHGADGFVFGILTRDGSIDVTRCQLLKDLCSPSPVTFHRAFDMVTDYKTALEEVISIGCERLLTSGLEPTALEGLDTLKSLIEQANGRIQVMPGGGINKRNLERILKGCGAQEFHCSARKTQDSEMVARTNTIHMGAACYPSEYSTKVTDRNIVKELVSKWKSFKHC
ncbi:copper homeostasis protein cutC homolog [Rhopilema esculentum]|uniref:copper homeostasis protein cutC homolog n=1 Tax=Rhopilema esculentum TaxID=499914 RepID=UPI0031CEEEC9